MFRVPLVFVLSAVAFRAGLATEPVGHFLLQEIDKANVKESNLRLADGLSIRFKWRSVDKGSTWDWSFLDSQVARCQRLGKPYMLRMMAGKHSPTWVGGPWYNEAPIPWNTTAQNALSQAIKRLGERYGGDPLLAGVHLTSTANHRNAEMHLADGITNQNDYSHAKMIGAWSAAIGSYSSAFRKTALILNMSMEPGSKGEITYPVVNIVKGLGARATFQHNALDAEVSPGWQTHALVLDLGEQGWRIGFQMVCLSSNRARFGGTIQQAYNKAGPNAQYFEIYQGDL